MLGIHFIYILLTNSNNNISGPDSKPEPNKWSFPPTAQQKNPQ
jgi:hypothetical protein